MQQTRTPKTPRSWVVIPTIVQWTSIIDTNFGRLLWCRCFRTGWFIACIDCLIDHTSVTRYVTNLHSTQRWKVNSLCSEWFGSERFRVNCTSVDYRLSASAITEGHLILENFPHIPLFRTTSIVTTHQTRLSFKISHNWSFWSVFSSAHSCCTPSSDVLLTTGTPKNLEMFVCYSSNDSESDMPTISCSCPPDMYHIDVSVFCCVPVLTLNSTSVCLVWEIWDWVMW